MIGSPEPSAEGVLSIASLELCETLLTFIDCTGTLSVGLAGATFSAVCSSQGPLTFQQPDESAMLSLMVQIVPAHHHHYRSICVPSRSL